MWYNIRFICTKMSARLNYSCIAFRGHLWLDPANNIIHVGTPREVDWNICRHQHPFRMDDGYVSSHLIHHECYSRQTFLLIVHRRSITSWVLNSIIYIRSIPFGYDIIIVDWLKNTKVNIFKEMCDLTFSNVNFHWWNIPTPFPK